MKPDNIIQHFLKKSEKNNPLFKSIAAGDITQLTKLIEQNPALVNQEGKTKLTPLHLAIFFEQLDIAKYLVEKGANLNVTGEIQIPGYYSDNSFEVKSPNMSYLDRLVRGAISRLSGGALYKKGFDRLYFTPLASALYVGFAGLALHIVENGDVSQTVNIIQKKGLGTYLHQVACMDSTSKLEKTATPLVDTKKQIVNALIKQGAEIDIKDKHGYTPLVIALRHEYIPGQDEFVLFLVKQHNAKMKEVPNELSSFTLMMNDMKTVLHTKPTPQNKTKEDEWRHNIATFIKYDKMMQQHGSFLAKVKEPKFYSYQLGNDNLIADTPHNTNQTSTQNDVLKRNNIMEHIRTHFYFYAPTNTKLEKKDSDPNPGNNNNWTPE